MPNSPEATPREADLTRPQTRALLVAILTGIFATLLFTLSGSTDTDQFRNQLTACGGIILSLIVESSIKSKRWTLRLASTGLLLGATLPWLYLTIPDSVLRQLLRNASWVSSGIFSFGTAFLVKSVETSRTESSK